MVSVNSVVAAHLVTNPDFSPAAIWNEFQLVAIGAVLAIILNLFNANFSHKRKLVSDMRDTEKQLQSIMKKLAAYLSGNEAQYFASDDTRALEERIQGYTQSASEYNENSFQSHPEYYSVLMDLQDFLTLKEDFVSRLDQTQLKRYWQRS